MFALSFSPARQILVAPLLLVLLLPGRPEAQVTSATTITRAQFAALRWLEGRWLGSGGNYPRFFEEYVFVNDTTIEQREFGMDSTFTSAPNAARIVLSQGRILSLRRGAQSASVARIATDTVWFETGRSGSGYRWHRVDGNEWVATLGGGSAPTVYRMRRVGGWVGGASSMADARASVERAALDYLEAFYEGDSTKHIRSIDPAVHKMGYSRRREGGFAMSRMSWEEFHAFTRTVRTSGRGGPPPGAPKRVEVLDVLDQIAVAKVTAWWGVDYLTMARQDGRWRVVQVLWQSPPR